MSKVEQNKPVGKRLRDYLADVFELKNNSLKKKQVFEYYAKDAEYDDDNTENGNYDIDLIDIPLDNHQRGLICLTKNIYTRYYSITPDGKVSIRISLPQNGSFDLKTEHDKSAEAVAAYQERYDGSRIKPDKNNKFYLDDKIELGGEVDFNFGLNKLIEFRKLLLDKKDTIPFVYELLNLCAKYNYNPVNYSLMPVTGGMQYTKQNFGKDRFDTFISTLDQYYYGNEMILNSASCTVENCPTLKEILDSYTDVYDYCAQMYSIHDRELIDELIRSGVKTIDGPARIIAYCSLALRVWNERKMQA